MAVTQGTRADHHRTGCPRPLMVPNVGDGNWNLLADEARLVYQDAEILSGTKGNASGTAGLLLFMKTPLTNKDGWSLSMYLPLYKKEATEPLPSCSDSNSCSYFCIGNTPLSSYSCGHPQYIPVHPGLYQQQLMSYMCPKLLFSDGNYNMTFLSELQSTTSWDLWGFKPNKWNC